MNPLRQIASHLSQAFADKVALNIRLSNQKQDLEARKVALAPPDGWEGKNAELRELAQKRAYATDPVCRQIETEIRRLEDALGLAETALETATNQRRAEEWIIRARLLEALMGNVVTVQGDPTRVEDTAFDDFLDDVADRALEEKYVNPALASDVPWDTLTSSGPGGQLLDLPVPTGIAEEEDLLF